MTKADLVGCEACCWFQLCLIDTVYCTMPGGGGVSSTACAVETMRASRQEQWRVSAGCGACSVSAETRWDLFVTAKPHQAINQQSLTP